MKELLLNYAKYNLWANQRVCDFLAEVEEEKLNREIVSSFTSLRKTVFHVYGAQALWLKRLGGESPSVFPAYESKSSSETLQLLIETSQQLIAYVESRSEEQLMEMLDYKNVAGQPFTNCIRDIIQHVVNHATYHRGQVITMLRQVGYTKLFPTDYVAFCRE
ncbi:MAG TPA: DinB family protein [Bacteroidia bacterium]|nr:DinB family protein [Bacteroidia bacterium]